VGSILTVADNAVTDMTSDVEGGTITNMGQLGDKIGEKILVPGGIAFAAYMREMDVRQRVERRLDAFNKRQREWAKTLREKSGDEAVSKKLLSAMTKLAQSRAEAAVRKNERWKLDGSSDSEFERLVQDWFDAATLRIDLIAGALDATSVDATIEAWEAAESAKKSAQAKK
jgi:hypothetical protein